MFDFANPGKKYKTANHLTYSCQYHVIFCPKYRRPVLKDGVHERCKELFTETSQKYGFEILEMEVMPDHVHLLMDCNPRMDVLDCIRKMKGYTSRTLREEFPSLKSRLPSLWTRSCFISTVGSVSLDVVKKYIEDQRNA